MFQKWEKAQPELIAIDTETTGIEWNDKAFCVTVAWEESQGHYIDLARSTNGHTISKVILHGTPRWTFHNAKFDLHKLLQAQIITRGEITWERFNDTETMAHLWDEHTRLGLKHLVRTLLKVDTFEEEDLKIERRRLKLKKEDGYDKLPDSILIPYAIKDAEYTLGLHNYLSRRIPHVQPLYQTEKQLTLVLLDMERAGIKVDTDYLNSAIRDYRHKVLDDNLQIRKLAGREDFNPNSPFQVLQALEDRGLHITSTSKDVLRTFDDSLATRIVSFRENQKILSTYLENLEKLTSTSTVVHPWFRQNNTRTGRMASGKVHQ